MTPGGKDRWFPMSRRLGKAIAEIAAEDWREGKIGDLMLNIPAGIMVIGACVFLDSMDSVDKITDRGINGLNKLGKIALKRK